MKRGVFILILLLVIIALTGCAEVDEEATVMGDKTTGGVIICNQDYPCGAADNICPEDYGADCKVEDPDCEVLE